MIIKILKNQKKYKIKLMTLMNFRIKYLNNKIKFH